ncbi:MAG: hypothetical protein PVJ85_17060 [Anaerolineae bacterium]|jgi:hypothetical protein
MPEFGIPRVYHQFLDNWPVHKDALLATYADHQLSFVPNLLPEQAMGLTAEETLHLLRRRLGDAVDLALAHAGPGQPARDAPQSLQSPVAGQPDGRWLRQSNMVGINVRTIGSFWNVVKYTLTLPHIHGSIHLLPIWEPGVVGSLYGISSWNLNTEFYSPELAQVCPHLDTVAKQLQAVIHLLHAMGRAVGMDVIPHTDRFSEIALAQPQFFEWLQREGTEIVDHTAGLHRAVQARILQFLAANGPALPDEVYPPEPEAFFGPSLPESQRLRILFGPAGDRTRRFQRRNQLVAYLHAYGYEPVPATMAPPFRGIEVDPSTSYTDSQSLVWYDYRITQPELMSRVFGPLARYKLYERLDDNAQWAIDFERPRPAVWRYLCEHYYDVQRRFGFDFMRGDMSHVQMRPGGVPAVIDEHYDILRAVKTYISDTQGVRHFGYFAETFLAARNVMVYGDEIDHLEASDADATLGDLQSTSVGSPEFLQRWRQYHDLATVRRFAPSFTLITGDKDDPRFDQYYIAGNLLRLFVAYFLTDVPSYVALGFATRDLHHQPAPNEHYTKLYVFQESSGPKATHGPYIWGKNGALFHDITRLRLYADRVVPHIAGQAIRWLIHPDPTGLQHHVAWTQRSRPQYVIVANTDPRQAVDNFNLPAIPGLGPDPALALDFSTAGERVGTDPLPLPGIGGFKVQHLGPGEGRVYRVVPAS